MGFRDRTDAGRQLGETLAGLTFHDPVVLALPRGGVPVALEIARRLGAPLDLLLVRKIGAPGYSEFGIGAVMDGEPPQRVINSDAVRYTRATDAYIETETQRQLEIIAQRRTLYTAGRKPCVISGRDVIVTDDGIATGSTVRAALKGLRGQNVLSITLAVPVSPPEVARKLEKEVDRLVCLATPDFFSSVGEHYSDFRQLSDEDVIALLAQAHQPERGTPSSPSRSS
jgi:putative phosphoribosyl transferase